MAIVNLPLPNQIADGQVADAVPLMANFNYIANQVNANVVGNSFSASIFDTGYGYQVINAGLSNNANSGFGYQALQNASASGQNNSAFGYQALQANTTGNTNTAIGVQAMQNATGSVNNTALGYQAMQNLTTGTLNTALGYQAMQSIGSGVNNVAIGGYAMLNATGSQNMAIGRQSMANAGAATQCVYMGYQSGNNCTGSGNTGIGFAALGSGSGTYNVAIGYEPLGFLTTGGNNIVIGYQAGWSVTTQSGNVFIGTYSAGSTTGAIATSVAVGFETLFSSSLSSSADTAIGCQALAALTTGTNCTALGYQALYGNSTFSDCTGLGSAAAVTASSQVQLGDAATTTYAYGAVQNRSDLRDKADVRDTVMGLDFINTLRPVDYKWDMREDYRTDPTVPLHAITHDGSKKRSRYHHGFIAQEVHAASMGQFGGVQHHAIKGGHDVWSIGEGELIACLTKAVQELSAKVKALEAK